LPIKPAIEPVVGKRIILSEPEKLGRKSEWLAYTLAVRTYHADGNKLRF
jgi:hypothetical protein